MEIRSLTGVGMDVILTGFEEAFGGYAVDFDRQELVEMFRRRGFDPDVSFGAFDNGALVSFILTGLGQYDGIPTAYDCATGTTPAYRGRHLAATLFDSVVAGLRERGIRQYLLEVLSENEPAIELYRRKGFAVAAEYDCFRIVSSDLVCSAKEPEGDFEIRRFEPELLGATEAFCDFSPSWQNSLGSLMRGAAGLGRWGAYVSGNLVGCCVHDPVTGDVARIAVAPGFRRRGIASVLMKRALSESVSETAKVLNIPVSDKTLRPFLTSLGFSQGLSQYGMIRQL